jgi:hypothetical protein
VLVPPDDVEADGSLSMKFPWWRGPEVRGALSIAGRERTRSLPIRADIPDGYGDTGFQATGISFPVEGCYEITGTAGGAALTFVTLVEPCSVRDELPPAEQARATICDA